MEIDDLRNEIQTLKKDYEMEVKTMYMELKNVKEEM